MRKLQLLVVTLALGLGGAMLAAQEKAKADKAEKKECPSCCCTPEMCAKHDSNHDASKHAMKHGEKKEKK